MADRLSRRQLIELGIVLALPLNQVPGIDGLGFPDIGSVGTVDNVTGNLRSVVPRATFNVFYSGMGTDQGQFANRIDPRNNFGALRQELEGRGLGQQNSLFYTYGQRRLNQYSSRDTIIDPELNVSHALDDISIWDQSFTEPSYNIIVFSLGGIFGLAVAQRYPEKIRSLTLISSPVRGIRYSLGRKVALETGKIALLAATGKSLVGEKVSRFLFDRWEDDGFKWNLDEFGRRFTGEGKSLTVVRSLDDPIFDPESTEVAGANYIDLTAGKSDPLHFLEAHSHPVRDLGVAQRLALIISAA